jgi:ubiquinone/menaquinone biosynthesis C-methylase UbiE
MFMKQKLVDPQIADQMRRDWDERARTNGRHYVATAQTTWSDEDFFRSGQLEINDIVLSDMQEICKGRAATEMRVLEIGCGAGRMTEPLSRIFGKVDAVDISSEMIAQAQAALAARKNVQFHLNNGVDLSMLEDASFDFALSAIVFQHIPRKAIVENYICETWRVLRPHTLFKFQVQGVAIPEESADTWVGAGFSEAEIANCAAKSGFRIEKSHGAGTQYYWLTFLKP